MSIGSKIKALRKKRGMTQDALAENIVSRSMLSRIESGSAEPSIGSLKAIAARLGIPAGFLLEDGEDLLPAERSLYTKQLFDSLGEKDFRTCLDIFSRTDFPRKKEFNSVYAFCAFSVAYEDFLAGNFSEARDLLLATENILPELEPSIPTVTGEKISLLNSVMDNISTLDKFSDFAPSHPDFSFQLSAFFFLLKLLSDGRVSDCNAFIEFGNLDYYYADYLRAQILIKDYKFIDALLLLKNISSKDEIPYFLRLMSYLTIENCCKLCEDFKGAYENRLLYISLLEKIT